MSEAISKHKIRNLWCIGRNYSEHARELGNEVPEAPLVFLKAGSSIQPDERELVFPSWLEGINYEVELALQFNENLQIKHGCLAIDFTERNQQDALRKKGYPWTLAKSFSGATATSNFFEIDSLSQLNDFEMKLRLNDEQRQHGLVSHMVFDLGTLVDYVKSHFPICPGDLILTGTPAGVGAIANDDRIEVECNRGVQHSWIVRLVQEQQS